MRDRQNGRFLKKSEEEIKEIINKKFTNFEYIGDYSGSEGYLKLRCRQCGNIIIKNSQILRPSRNKKLCCPECIKLKKENKEKTKEREQRVKEREQRVKEREQKAKEKEEQKEKRLWSACKECGKKFKGNRAGLKYCSDKCRRKQNNRRREINRRHKLRDNGEIHWDITLDKLVKRDKRICHICGEKVDMEADTNADTYGSIDHVIPVNKGGTHTWDNVRLAHRKCNIIKSNKTFIEGKNGQLRIAT